MNSALLAKRSWLGPWAGLAICALGYTILSLQPPQGWTIPVWAVLAFLVVPGVAGYLVGRWMGPDREPRARFWAAFWPAAIAMMLYGGLTLVILRVRSGSTFHAGSVVLAGYGITVLAAAVAGLVAGLASVLAARRPGG